MIKESNLERGFMSAVSTQVRERPDQVSPVRKYATIVVKILDGVSVGDARVDPIAAGGEAEFLRVISGKRGLCGERVV